MLNLFLPSVTPALLNEDVVGRVVVLELGAGVRDAGIEGALVVLGGLVTLGLVVLLFSAAAGG